jgi:hypothetical protein
MFLFLDKRFGGHNLEMPRKSRENYYKNRRKLTKQLEENERNPRRPANSSTERTRECRQRQNSARQEAIHPSSTREPQPSTSTAQIKCEQQEQIEIDDIDPNFQFFTTSMEYQCTSPIFVLFLKNFISEKTTGHSSKCAATYIVGLRQLPFAEYFNDVESVR